MHKIRLHFLYTYTLGIFIVHSKAVVLLLLIHCLLLLTLFAVVLNLVLALVFST